MILATIVVASALSVSGPMPSAQKAPDFSGTWTEDTSQRKSTELPAAGDARKSAALPPADMIVRHTAETFTHEQTFMSQVVRYTYRLDGKESVNHNGANTQTTRTRWEGSRLISEGTSYSVTSAGESSWQFKETRWLNPKGQLVVETIHKDDATGKVLTVTRVWSKK